MNHRLFVTLAALAMVTLGTMQVARAVDQSSGESGKMAEKELIFAASDLSSLDVRNRSDIHQKLGKVDNLLIQADTGEVLYGVLDTGIGGKLIPIPWNATRLFQWTSNNKYFLTVNKNSTELAGAPSFDKKHLPNFTSTQWKEGVDKFFGVHMVAHSPEQGNIGQQGMKPIVLESSTLRGMHAVNRTDTDKKLGKVDDLIINAHTGQVLYGIVDTGLLGKNIAVPWAAFGIQKVANKDEMMLTLAKTSDELSKAPTFDKKHLGNVDDPNWQKSVDDFFGVRTVARPRQ